MWGHNEEVEASALLCVAPPNKECKQLILQHHVKEIYEDGIMQQVMKEQHG